MYFVPPDERDFAYGGDDADRELVHVYRHEDVLRVAQ